MTDSGSAPDAAHRPPREPSAAAVIAQLDRILASREFVQSARLKRFLRFVVEETLAGRADALKEYAIALDVFEREESFDPQTSSIVRVEASRLRAKLARYNAVEGRADPVHIDLPPGQYVPTFEAAAAGPAPIAKQRDATSSAFARRLFANKVAVFTGIVLAVGVTAAILAGPALLGLRTASPPEALPTAEPYSVAVLPLRDLSVAGTDDYLSDGMTDALITRLAMGGTLRVTSMTSVMAYKGVDRPMAEIARELGVGYVVEGSVLRIENKVRITAQLIDAASDRHVWADSYEREFADVLALQEDVAGRIVAALTGRVAPAGGLATRSPPRIDPIAYEAHLRGRYFLRQMTEEGFKKGIAYFEQAIEKAPNFAPARAGMATCYCLLGGHGFELVRPSEGMPAAKKAVMEALRLDDTLAEAHAFLGIIRLKYEWDWPGAEAAFQRSIALDPSSAQAHIFYSYFLEAMGRQEAAVREAEIARDNDPLSRAANVNLGWQYLQANRPDQAKRIFDSTAELDASFWGVHWGLGHYHRRKGEYPEAIAAFQAAIAAGGGHAMPLSALGYTYAIAGQPAGAKDMLARLAALAETSYVSPFNMAVIHAGLGDKAQAFARLEDAFAQRSRSMAWLNVTKELEDLRADPRFTALLRRIGLTN